MAWECITVALALAGCSGASAPSTQAPRLRLGQSVAYIGTTNVCALAEARDCLRGPGAPGTYVSISQEGNASSFAVSSADPSIAVGVVAMRGPGGQGDPVLDLVGHRAGSTTLTVTGTNGAAASLPITVTTVATLTLQLKSLPSVTNLSFRVRTPDAASCLSYEGGYSFNWGVSQTGSATLENFPAMGAGPLPQCVFSIVEVTGTDNSGASIVDKIFRLPITLGRDNSTALSLP
jgi:hypothetical protein